ncbi:hypothetical protein CAPTEDRAFT_226445 [Capitella teleta]|uniref:Sushi domain-containing protein n=1 Tax=Capitella teleta TaxID=283909 RepID=R7TT82_CAPTE|nr:hypothetical protein CAPTEDRAFT_226445 [Capitella teleta]|eukprot:ELT94701.1 hypothetical protein CAPTEDRAFT_226445 [Capitella teleta]
MMFLRVFLAFSTLHEAVCPNPLTYTDGAILKEDSLMTAYSSDTVSLKCQDKHYYVSGDEALVKCDEGYALENGNLSVTTTCEHTEWTIVEAICQRIYCPDIPVIDYGAVSGSGGAGTDVSITCMEGFYVNGSSTVSCSVAGTWLQDFPSCEVIYCPLPESIANGMLHYNDHTYLSEVQYTCNTGYNHGSGSLLRTCLDDFNWNGSTPTCEIVRCTEPPVIPRASLHLYPDNVFGSVIEYSCVSGYESPDNKTLQCSADGLWVGAFVCHQQCSLLKDNLGNGRLVTYSTIHGGEVEYECNEGYVLIPKNYTSVCDDGVWTRGPPACEKLLCEELLPSDSSVVEYVDGNREFNSIAQVKCKPGYFTKEDGPILICLRDGSWNGTLEINCEKISCDFPRIIANSVRSGNGSLYLDQVQYTCNEGFIMTPSSGSNSTCDENGNWTSSNTSCERVSCGSPGNDSAILLTAGPYVYEDVVRYGCPIGQVFDHSENKERTCQSNGSWTREQPRCVWVNCREPDNTTHALLINFTHFEYSGVVEYACIEGYALASGNLSQKCLSTGSWSGAKPSCEVIHCSSPLSTNATLLTPEPHSYGTTAQYECSVGWNHTEGDLIRLCLSDGSWSGTAPVCEVVDCGDPGNATKAMVVNTPDFTYASLIQYECDLGYVLASGSLIIECLEDGSWSSSQPICEIVECDQPGDIEDGVVIGSAYRYQDQVTYECNAGFALDPATPTKTCQWNGTWTGEQVECSRVDCGPPGNISAASLVEPYGSVYGDEVSFECLPGYVAGGGKPSISCLASGSWSTTDFNCTLSDCGVPNTPANARIVGDNYTFGHVIRYECNDGFILTSGQASRTCLANQQWDGVEPTCESSTECPEPGPVAHSTHRGSYAAHGTVTFECIEGYSINTAINCGPPPHVPNAVSHGSTYYNGYIVYICKEGFLTSSSDTILKCSSNGSYAGDLPVCEALSENTPIGITCPVINVNGRVATHGVVTTSCSMNALERFGAPERSIECSASGFWSASPGSCGGIRMHLALIFCYIPFGFLESRKTCHAPLLVAHATAEILGTRHGDKVTYRCMAGYNFPDEKYCRAVETFPNSLPDHLHNHLDAVVKYTCLPGFHYEDPLEFTRSITCQSNALWDIAATDCTAITCPSVVTPSGSEANSTATHWGSKVQFTCLADTRFSDGQEMKFTQCGGHGNWTAIADDCQGKDCGTPPEILHAFVEYTDTVFESEARYACLTGHRFAPPLSSYVIECSSNGRWTSPVKHIECHLVDCGSQPIIKNASPQVFQPPPTTFNSSIVFGCQFGFSFADKTTEKEVICGEHGQWLGVDIECHEVICPLPTWSHVIHTTSTNYMTELVYSCDSDTNLMLPGGQVNSTAVCSIYSTWIPEPEECIVNKSAIIAPVPVEAQNADTIGAVSIAFLTTLCVVVFGVDVLTHSRGIVRIAQRLGHKVHK